jgi:hypothetical protein
MIPSDASSNLPNWRIAGAFVRAGTALVWRAAAWLIDQQGPQLFGWVVGRRR